MPKITKRSYRINKKDIEFTIAYSLKDQEFYITLPDWMAGLLQTERLGAKTQWDVEQALEQAVKKYGNLTKLEEKVIFYTFKSMIRELNFEDDNAAQGLDEMCSEGVALDLWFRVGYVVRDPTENREIYLTEEHKCPRGAGVFAALEYQWCHYMTYTPEREQFFLAFREWLITGIVKMGNFFKETELPVLMDELVRNRKALPFKDST